MCFSRLGRRDRAFSSLDNINFASTLEYYYYFQYSLSTNFASTQEYYSSATFFCTPWVLIVPVLRSYTRVLLFSVLLEYQFCRYSGVLLEYYFFRYSWSINFASTPVLHSGVLLNTRSSTPACRYSTLLHSRNCRYSGTLLEYRISVLCLPLVSSY